MSFKLKQVLMSEAGVADGGSAGTGDPSGEPSGKPTAPASPNEGWQNDPSLDENGNPKVSAPPAEQKQTPPAEEPAKETEDKGTEDKSSEVPAVDVNSPVAEQAKALVEEAGLNAADVAKAVNENNGKVTPAIMKALVEKHGDALANMLVANVEGIYKSNANKAKEKTKTNNEAIFNHVQEAFKDVTNQAGKDTWKELSDWAKANIPADERKEINKVLSQGGLATTMAVDALVNRFKGSQKQAPETQDAVLLDGDSSAPRGGFETISKSEYVKQLRELEAKGHIYGESQEMAKLDARRARSIQRGVK